MSAAAGGPATQSVRARRTPVAYLQAVAVAALSIVFLQAVALWAPTRCSGARLQLEPGFQLNGREAEHRWEADPPACIEQLPLRGAAYHSGAPALSGERGPCASDKDRRGWTSRAAKCRSLNAKDLPNGSCFWACAQAWHVLVSHPGFYLISRPLQLDDWLLAVLTMVHVIVSSSNALAFPFSVACAFARRRGWGRLGIDPWVATPRPSQPPSTAAGPASAPSHTHTAQRTTSTHRFEDIQFLAQPPAAGAVVAAPSQDVARAADALERTRGPASSLWGLWCAVQERLVLLGSPYSRGALAAIHAGTWLVASWGGLEGATWRRRWVLLADGVPHSAVRPRLVRPAACSTGHPHRRVAACEFARGGEGKVVMSRYAAQGAFFVPVWPLSAEGAFRAVRRQLASTCTARELRTGLSANALQIDRLWVFVHCLHLTWFVPVLSTVWALAGPVRRAAAHVCSLRPVLPGA